MARIDLDVSAQDRHLARQLGARFDAARGCWFVPHGTPPDALLGWSCASALVNARAHSYYVLESEQICEPCRRASRVLGIVLPTGHEVRLQSDSGDGWERSDEPSLIAFVTHLAPSVVTRLREDSYGYRLRDVWGEAVSYHLNHCIHCGAPFDEYALCATPGRGFEVLSECEAANIRVTAVASGFAGAAEHFSYGVAFLDAMRKR